MSQAGASAAAHNASVATGTTTDDQAMRERYAAEAEEAVVVIEAKIAGMKETLTAVKAEAKRLRAEAESRGDA